MKQLKKGVRGGITKEMAPKSKPKQKSATKGDEDSAPASRLSTPQGSTPVSPKHSPRGPGKPPIAPAHDVAASPTDAALPAVSDLQTHLTELEAQRKQLVEDAQAKQRLLDDLSSRFETLSEAYEKATKENDKLLGGIQHLEGSVEVLQGDKLLLQEKTLMQEDEVAKQRAASEARAAELRDVRQALKKVEKLLHNTTEELNRARAAEASALSKNKSCELCPVLRSEGERYKKQNKELRDIITQMEEEERTNVPYAMRVRPLNKTNTLMAQQIKDLEQRVAAQGEREKQLLKEKTTVELSLKQLQQQSHRTANLEQRIMEVEVQNQLLLSMLAKEKRTTNNSAAAPHGKVAALMRAVGAHGIANNSAQRAPRVLPPLVESPALDDRSPDVTPIKKRSTSTMNSAAPSPAAATTAVVEKQEVRGRDRPAPVATASALQIKDTSASSFAQQRQDRSNVSSDDAIQAATRAGKQPIAKAEEPRDDDAAASKSSESSSSSSAPTSPKSSRSSSVTGKRKLSPSAQNGDPRSLLDVVADAVIDAATDIIDGTEGNLQDKVEGDAHAKSASNSAPSSLSTSQHSARSSPPKSPPPPPPPAEHHTPNADAYDDDQYEDDDGKNVIVSADRHGAKDEGKIEPDVPATPPPETPKESNEPSWLDD